MNKVQKAWMYNEYGSTEVLQFGDFPVPKPGPGQLLLQVRAAALNPADFKIREGLLRNADSDFPAVPGCDMSGVVVEVGDGVSKFKNGDEIYSNIQNFTAGRPKQCGTIAQYTVVEEYLVAPKPINLSFEEAASLPLALQTAQQGFDIAIFEKGQSVFIVGGAGRTPAERFNAVVAWSISTTSPLIIGKSPYNPILGETHHVSCGNLNVLLEQVSHHPPISALHATDEARKFELNWWQRPVPRFYGRSIEATIHGKRELKLLELNETYEMNSPKLCLRFFPFPSAEWSGDVLIQCKQSGLRATLCYRGKSLLGFKGSSTRITGRIGHIAHGGDLYELQGNWDQIITVKEMSTGKTSILYDAKAVISNMKVPVVQNAEGVASTESALVWSEVSESIMKGDWNKAREAKRCVEEKHRKEEGRWQAKHFTISSSHQDSGEWVYLHRPQCVPPAPIILPPSPQR